MTTKTEGDLVDELVKFSETLGLIRDSAKQMEAGIRKAFEGFQGLIQRHEATGTVWGVWERPQSFTPEQFNNLWKNFTHQRKVEYVLSLIT